MTQKTAPNSQSLRRAISILRTVANCETDGVRISEIAVENKLHVATCHRLLKALCDERLLLFSERKRTYRLGAEVRRLGMCADRQSGLEHTFQVALERIAERTGDTVFLSVRSIMNAICLARVEGSYPIRTLVLDIGSVRPLGVGAGSLALCAFMDDEKLVDIISSQKKNYSTYGLQINDVWELINRTREQGYAVNDGRVIPEYTGVGVLFPTNVGNEQVAISVAAVNSRMKPARQAEIALEICASCDELLGFRPVIYSGVAE